MDKSHDDAGPFRCQDPLKVQPFARLQQAAAAAPSLKSSLELGEPLLSFPTPPVAFHLATRQEDQHDHGMGARENNNNNSESQERLLETNSSVTPLDLYRPSTTPSWTSQEGSESTSGITPCISSWSSLLSDYSDYSLVPSLNNFRETRKAADSTARSVPGRDGRQLHEEDDHRHCGRLRLGDDEGEQRVPIHVRSNDATAPANFLPADQSSQFSNSWPVSEGTTLTRAHMDGGELEAGPSFAGSDRGSFTGPRPRPTLTSGQRIDAEMDAGAATNVSSEFCLRSVYSKRPMYALIPSDAFSRVAEVLKGKNKVEHMSTTNSETGVDGTLVGKSPQGLPRISVGLGWYPESRRGRVEPRGLNTMGPVRGNCTDSGAKRCDWKQANAEDAQPMDTDAVLSVEHADKVNRQSSEAERSGKKQSRVRTSSESEAADEFVAGSSCFTKRSRQDPVVSETSRTVQGENSEGKPQGEHAHCEKTEPGVQSCNWLQRWLTANSSLLGTTAAREEDSRLSNGPVSLSRSDGRGKVGLSCRGAMQASKARTENMREGHGREWDRYPNRLREVSSKGEPFKLSPFSGPSASAIAMIGAASRCLGPQLTFTQPKSSSIMMRPRPSDKKLLKVKHVQFAEQQISS